MSIDIRYPNITATDTEGKMSQMQSYMHQLVEQLNWALSTVNNAIEGNTSNVVMPSQNGSNGEDNAVDTFNSIKALIIKSADIVQAYEDVMMKDFNGKYFAESDFGTYLEDTKHTIEDNSKYTKDEFAKVQTITTGLENELKETEAYIKRGELYEDKDGPVYGIEVGQTDTNGLFSKFARFTAKKLSFYDEQGDEVAYISQKKLYISEATFLYNIQLRGYLMDTSDGLAFVWNGG